MLLLADASITGLIVEICSSPVMTIAHLKRVTHQLRDTIIGQIILASFNDIGTPTEHWKWNMNHRTVEIGGKQAHSKWFCDQAKNILCLGSPRYGRSARYR